MTAKEIKLSSQMKALKKTDLSPIVRMGGMMAPRFLGGFLPKLDEKQRAAFDKAMPKAGGRKIFIHLAGTPTPPIVIQLAQPMQMSVVSEEKVKAERIKGLTLTVEDLQLAKDKEFGKLLWRLKGQLGTMMGLTSLATPFIKLGPKGIKEIKEKAMKHFKPLMDLMP